MDYRTILTIKDRVGVFVVPLGLDAILRGWDVPGEKIRALDWWESVELDGLCFTLTPSQHFFGPQSAEGKQHALGRPVSP